MIFVKKGLPAKSMAPWRANLVQPIGMTTSAARSTVARAGNESAGGSHYCHLSAANVCLFLRFNVKPLHPRESGAEWRRLLAKEHRWKGHTHIETDSLDACQDCSSPNFAFNVTFFACVLAQREARFRQVVLKFASKSEICH